MLEVYVDYVECEQNKKGVKATLHLSTEKGAKGEVSVAENGITLVDLMTKYLAHYSNGLYSSQEGKFIALADYSDSLQGYEPYHLNYCPEFIEREFRHSDNSVSGYTFGSWNPIYGDKIKCHLSDIECNTDDNGACFVMVGLYDDFGSFVDTYPVIVGGATLNECALNAVKETARCYYYSLEEGGWDCHTGLDDTDGPCHDIDLEYDEQTILDLDFNAEQ